LTNNKRKYNILPKEVKGGVIRHKRNVP
jgi:hypothetical protein